MRGDRGHVLGDALRLVVLLAEARVPMRTIEVARELELHYRTALRWLEAAEAAGIVENAAAQGSRPWRWALSPRVARARARLGVA